MLTFVAITLALICGYLIGHNMGVARTMMKMQDLLQDMQAIVDMLDKHEQQWNEDNL